jgi:hypothetical protein
VLRLLPEPREEFGVSWSALFTNQPPAEPSPQKEAKP